MSLSRSLERQKNLEVGEDETKRIRIAINNGKLEVTAETIPDLDALSLEQMYALQAEYEERLSAMEDAEPDDSQDSEAYDSWEATIDQLEQDLREVEDAIEARLEEDAGDLDEDDEGGEDDSEPGETDSVTLNLINVDIKINADESGVSVGQPAPRPNSLRPRQLRS